MREDEERLWCTIALSQNLTQQLQTNDIDEITEVYDMDGYKCMGLDFI